MLPHHNEPDREREAMTLGSLQSDSKSDSERCMGGMDARVYVEVPGRVFRLPTN